MDMLERYLYDIGRRLPAAQREDIEKELRSLLLDAIEAKAQGREATTEEVAEVLREFGRPEEVAGRYIGEQSLIGPKYYALYLLVLKIVLGAVALGLCISMAVGAVFGPPPETVSGMIGMIINFFGRFLGSVISAALSAVGSVTIVFAIIESVEKHREAKVKLPEWNPRDLPPVPNHKQGYKRADSIVALVFIVIGFVLFNGYPGLLAAYFQNGQGLQSIPLLSGEAFTHYLPLWNIGWALALVLHVVLLMQGRWSTITNLARIGIEIFSIAVLAYMFNGPQLLNTTLVESVGKYVQVAGFNFAQQFRWVFILGIFGSAIEIITTVARMVREKE